MKICSPVSTRTADRHFVRRQESGVVFIHRAPLQCLERALHGPPRYPGDGVLARLHCLHVDADGTSDGYAVIAGTARQMGRIGARDQCLGRRASGIDTGAAKELAFDNRHLPTRACEAPSERRPGLPGPDDDRIKFVHGLASWSHVA